MRRAASVLAVLTLVAAAPALAMAEGGPVPPCAGEAFPAPAAVGEPLDVRVWYPPAGEDEGRWAPPACVGWTGESYSALVASAGRFRQAGASEALLGRIGAISRMTSIRYWSVTRSKWRPLFTDAAALSGSDADSRRPDFAPDELTAGRVLHFLQEENEPTRPVVYRLEVRERGPDRIVFALVNVTPIALAILTLAEPGGYEFLYFLERERGEVWRYYSLYRARIRLNLLPRRLEASMTNRAGAIFRYLAGMPTDREPPPARYSKSPP